MKNIKSYNKFFESSKIGIDTFTKAKYTQNKFGLYTIDGDFDCSNYKFSKLPFNIEVVNGSFFAHNCGLNSSENLPKDIKLINLSRTE